MSSFVLKASFGLKYHNLMSIELSKSVAFFPVLETLFNCPTCKNNNVCFFIKVINPKKFFASLKEFKKFIISQPKLLVGETKVTNKDRQVINVLEKIHMAEDCIKVCKSNNLLQLFFTGTKESFILQVENFFQLNLNWYGWQIDSAINSVKNDTTKAVLRDDLIMTCGLRQILEIHLRNNVTSLKFLCQKKIFFKMEEKINSFSDRKVACCNASKYVTKQFQKKIPPTLIKDIAQNFSSFLLLKTVLKWKEKLDIGDQTWKHGSDDRLSLKVVKCKKCILCLPDG